MLNRYGGRLFECRRVSEVGELLFSQQPDLILLDARGPASTGADATRSIRAHSSLPLIVLVPAHDEQRRVAPLDAGADDCMAIPFGSREMLERMRRVIEGSQLARARTPPDAFHTAALDVDFLAREVRLLGRPVHLTPTECKLLRVLLESAGKVVTHERLLQQVWGPAAIQNVRRLRIHMKQLQRKFELAPPSALYLIDVPAVGYRLWLPA